MTASGRLDHLDLLRGLAALLVLVGHLRGYLLASHSELVAGGHAPGIATKLFYFVTSLGHQAVVVFFALSGFLVGGKALSDLLAGRFTWPTYLLRRLTRLWIVVLPALVLTLCLDRLGILLGAGALYDGGAFEAFHSGPRAPEGADHSLPTLLGNLAFLQTVAVPVFGSNGPAWSLANEFWYYLFVPLAAWLALGGASAGARFAGLLALAAMAAFLPAAFLAGGLVWAAGAAAAWASRQRTLAPLFGRAGIQVASIGAIAAALVLARLFPSALGDVLLGMTVAAALPGLAYMPGFGAHYSGLARGVSEISYTLYLTHFPLLTMLFLGELAPAKLVPGWTAAIWFGAVFLVAIAWAAFLWWAFERNTDRVYHRLRNRLVAQVA